MSKDMNGMTIPELGEVVSAASFKTGIISGMEDAAKYLRTRSGAMFAEGKDEEAKTCRDLAFEVERQAKEVRTEALRTVLPEGDAAYKEMEVRQEAMKNAYGNER